MKTHINKIGIAILLLFTTQIATGAEPDKTPENVQKKAVVTKHNARIFKKAFGDEGSEASFMQIYFLMKPEINNRVPVSRSPYKSGKPDGWLDKNSFVPWNTLQMIKLEPQSGRKLAKIFDNKNCAELFGRDGKDHSGCQLLGEEPNNFTTKNDVQLLIPVFNKGRNSYQAGFIRVYQTGSRVAPSTKQVTTSNTTKNLGYDVVFAVDSTLSMGAYFNPTTEVLQTLIKHIQELVQGGEVKLPLRIGVLFYRDRLLQKNCNIGYLTKWAKHLTDDIDSVIEALRNERETDCPSEDVPESVLDGINRILNDTKWNDNSFKTIILVGDASPHNMNSDKNPMKLSVDSIREIANKKNIRFLNFKLREDDKAFKQLALQAEPQSKGRYANIPIEGVFAPSSSDIEKFKTSLLKTMIKEWDLLRAANTVVASMTSNTPTNSGKTGVDLLNDPAFRQKYHIDQYEALIIRARLPATTSTTQVVPQFVKGWISKEIQKQLAVGEFIFMDKSRLTILVSTLESIAEAAMIGIQDGGDAFITTIRSVLAAQTRVPPSQLFRSGESLSSTLRKAKILPFKTDILTFTAQEIATWKPEDYERINTILKEKVKVLREFMGNPTNSRMFGRMAHLYVPRAFFP